MRLSTLLRTIALVSLPILTFAQELTFTFDATDTDAHTSLQGKISDYQVVRIDVDAIYEHWKAHPGHIDLTLSGTAGEIALHLTPWELRSKDYISTVPGNERYGTPTKLHSPVYRGNVEQGGEAIFTFDKQFILAHWETGGRRFALEPLWRMENGADENLYLLYDETSVVDSGPEACATDVSEFQPTIGKPITGRRSTGECFEVDIALVADTELYAEFGNPASVENFMLGVLADVRTVYDDEFPDEIQWILGSTTIYTNTNVDPYTDSLSANALLDNFRLYSGSNPSSVPGVYDVASLWTGRDFTGGTVGIAYLNAVCNNGIRYNCLENFSNSSISLRNMWAHELGHNFNAPHDPINTSIRYIMYPSVTSANDWSQASINTIESFYNSISCLSSCVPEVAPTAVADLVYSNICNGCNTYFFDMSEGRVDSRVWTFPGGTPASSTTAAPEVTYNAPGLYEASLTVTNEFGSSTSSVTVSVSETGGTKVLMREDFEDDALRVSFVNPTNDALAFEMIATDGNRGVRSAYADNGTLDGRGTSDFIRTDFMNIDEVQNPRLNLQYAYTRWNSTFRDQLRVKVRQGGFVTQVFFGDETGSGNFATGPDRSTIGSGLFLPTTFEDWCLDEPGCISIDLTTFQGGGEIQIDIENDAGYGQPLYVDNIAVSGIFQTAALPVEWLIFEAHPVEKSVVLDWVVQQDETNLGFQVERRTEENQEWMNLGFVSATPVSPAEASYSFIDRTTTPGLTYHYRLLQQDSDGEESFSPIKSVRLTNEEKSIVAYPNPTRGSVFLSNSEDAVSFALYNGIGQRVLASILPPGGAHLELAHLPLGVYTLFTEKESLRLVLN